MNREAEVYVAPVCVAKVTLRRDVKLGKVTLVASTLRDGEEQLVDHDVVYEDCGGAMRPNFYWPVVPGHDVIHVKAKKVEVHRRQHQIPQDAIRDIVADADVVAKWLKNRQEAERVESERDAERDGEGDDGRDPEGVVKGGDAPRRGGKAHRAPDIARARPPRRG